MKKDILVVLNTNELSIAPNVGAISTYLNKIISLPVYNRFHENVEKFLKMSPILYLYSLNILNVFIGKRGSDGCE